MRSVSSVFPWTVGDGGYKSDGRYNDSGIKSKLDLIREVPPPEPEPDSDGWIEWKGGECPVDGKLEVEIRCRGEAVKTGIGPASMWLWKHSNSEIDITHYRIVTPAPSIGACHGHSVAPAIEKQYRPFASAEVPEIILDWSINVWR